MNEETYLGQIKINGQWLDYARGTEQQSRDWQQADPANRRVVDWIYKERILVAAVDEDRARSSVDDERRA